MKENNVNADKCILIQKTWRGHFLRRNVLEPCDCKQLGIDIQRLKKCLAEDYLTPGRLEYLSPNLILEDGFMKFLIAKCIGGWHVGEGYCPINVVKDDTGIDVLCMCLNGNNTNEKSIMQNLNDCGDNLDTLFSSGEYQKALSEFTREYYNKLTVARNTKLVKKLYYLVFISMDTNLYMSTFKINSECISNTRYENVSKQKKSIKFTGFVNSNLGATTLNKSKKRLEIRFNRDIINYYNTVKLI